MGAYRCSERTRRRIFEVAQQLFAEKGYEGTSLADIAARAEISTGTLYRYYPAKSDFLLYVGSEMIDDMQGFLASLPEKMSCADRVLALMVHDMDKCMSRLQFGGGCESEGGLLAMQLAHRSAVYSSEGNLRRADEGSAVFARLVEEILESAAERGEFVGGADVHALADVMVAVFFRQFDLALVDPEGEGSIEALGRKVRAVLSLALR